jgi:hypothetical protein
MGLWLVRHAGPPISYLRTPSLLVDQSRDFLQGPNMVRDTRRHRGGPGVGVLQALVGPSEVVCCKWRAIAAAWFSIFLENPLVSRVNQRIPILIVRLALST